MTKGGDVQHKTDGAVAWMLLYHHSARSKEACEWWNIPTHSREFADAITRLAGAMCVNPRDLYTLLAALIERDTAVIHSIDEQFRDDVALWLVDHHLLHTSFSISTLKRKIRAEARAIGLDPEVLSEFIRRRMTDVLTNRLKFTSNLKRVLHHMGAWTDKQIPCPSTIN